VSGGYLTNVVIDNNNFSNNRGGSGTTGLEAAVSFETWSAGKQFNVRVTNNTFTNNGKSVMFFNTTGVLIQGNTAQGAADWYSGSRRFEGNNHDVRITHNNIINNPGPGIAVDAKGVPGQSSGFVVTQNNITGNGTRYSRSMGVVITAADYTGAFDARDNWWGHTSGPSGDGPGTGDGIYGNAIKSHYWASYPGGNALFSPWSTSTHSITAPTLPGAPVNLQAAAAGNHSITLSWTLGSGSPTGVKIERSLDGLSFSQVVTLSGTPTSYTDNGLLQGTKYFYRVRATNTAGDSVNSNVANATTTGASATTFISDLAWTSATAGWGTVRKDLSVTGRTLSVGGSSYAKGLGTHVNSSIVYNLSGSYSRFQSDVGVDEAARGVGLVVFEVIGDGVLLYKSAVLTNGQVAKVDVSVEGVKQLTLRAVTGASSGSIDFGHADWAGRPSSSGRPASPPPPAASPRPR
jgi:hypothetical protein